MQIFMYSIVFGCDPTVFREVFFGKHQNGATLVHFYTIKLKLIFWHIGFTKVFLQIFAQLSKPDFSLHLFYFGCVLTILDRLFAKS